MIKIERKEYRKLVLVARVTRMYIETLTLIAIIRELPAATLAVAAVEVTVLAVLLTWLTNYPARWLREQFDVIDSAPIATHEYHEHGEPRTREVAVTKIGTLL
jgi:hypothetical protein